MMEYIKSIEATGARIQNEFKDHESAYAAYLAAQEQYQSIQAHLDSLTQVLEPAFQGSHEAQKHIQALKQGLIEQQSNLEKIVQSVPPVARKPPGATQLGEKLFAIPELLERILLYLQTTDLLRVQQVNHAFFDATQSSPKIQCKMGLRAQENAHIYFPPASCEPRRFLQYYDTYRYFSTKTVEGNKISFQPCFNNLNDPPKLGSRCRNMLICQPPVSSISVYTRCCHPTWPWRIPNTPLEKITSESGIRMGDLIDAHKRITADHKLCPDADPSEHDADGFVKSRVCFELILEAQPNDPVLLDKIKYDQSRVEEENKRTALERRMRPYILAKQSGKTGGYHVYGQHR